MIVRVESGLMFANADYVKSQIEALCTDQTKIVVLDGETSPFVDVSAATMLVELKSNLARRGIEFRIARDIGQVRDTLERAVEAPMLEIDATIDDALTAYERKANQGSSE